MFGPPTNSTARYSFVGFLTSTNTSLELPPTSITPKLFSRLMCIGYISRIGNVTKRLIPQTLFLFLLLCFKKSRSEVEFLFTNYRLRIDKENLKTSAQDQSITYD